MNESVRPLVSVCVPVYGVEAYIERCARSLLEQTYDNIELLFVDDCSNDKSFEILQETIKCYPKRASMTKILKHEKNRGLAAARNTGLDAASGKYLFHVDSDDWVDPEMVEVCVRQAEEKNADIVIFGVVHEYLKISKSDLCPMREIKGKNKIKILKDIITQRISNTIWGKMYLTDIYRANEIRALEGVNYAEDYAVYPLLFYYARKIISIDTVFYHYNRVNENSYTHVFSPIQLSNQMAAYRNIADVFRKKNLFGNELDIALLQIYAWARRKAVLAGSTKNVVVKETGKLNLTLRQWLSLSFNHKIIVAFDVLGVPSLTKAFVIISDYVRSHLYL